MPETTSERLKRNINQILNLWEKRVYEEIPAARHQEKLALRNSLPEYLAQMGKALSDSAIQAEAKMQINKEAIAREGKLHGRGRAGSINYTIDQLILEYHILRQVVCTELEKEGVLTPNELELIISFIEQAVNDAATEFSDTLKNIQDQLSHTLAHDLRNPIATAKISAQLILRRPEDQENCVSKARRITICMDRIDKMISDLLDASRIKAGQSLPIEFKRCDLDWILREVVDDLNFSYDFRFVLNSSGECFGMWNESGLRRAIENLATNAIKYGDKMNPVIITLGQNKELVALSIHNEGEPIPDEEKEILFQQFRRSKTVEKKSGWGLGLTVVKGMVDAHEGIIKVESQAGAGTTFTIFLPKDPQTQSLISRSSSKTKLSMTEGFTRPYL